MRNAQKGDINPEAPGFHDGGPRSPSQGIDASTPEGGRNLATEVQGQHPQWRPQARPCCRESVLGPGQNGGLLPWHSQHPFNSSFTAFVLKSHVPEFASSIRPESSGQRVRGGGSYPGSPGHWLVMPLGKLTACVQFHPWGRETVTSPSWKGGPAG